jgi:hypothetical protein
VPLQVDLQGEPALVSDGDRAAWCDPRRPGALGLAAPIAGLLREVVDNLE